MSRRKLSDEQLEVLAWEGDPEARAALGGDPWEESATAWVRRMLRRRSAAGDRLRLCLRLLLVTTRPEGSLREATSSWLSDPSWPAGWLVDGHAEALSERGRTPPALDWAQAAAGAAAPETFVAAVPEDALDALVLEEVQAALVRGAWVAGWGRAQGHDLTEQVVESLRVSLPGHAPAEPSAARRSAGRWLGASGVSVGAAVATVWTAQDWTGWPLVLAILVSVVLGAGAALAWVMAGVEAWLRR